MKRLTNCAIIAFAIMLSTFTCQKDDVKIEENINITESFSVKKLALRDIEELQPVVSSIKKLSAKIPDGMQARDFSFLSLDSLDVDNIIEYTDTTGYSTWTFKINSGDDSINFENLHLLETDDGYIGYILSYEPDETWYYDHLNLQHDEFILDMTNYTGDITKYSLEREIIWSSKDPDTYDSSASRILEYTLECTISLQMVCGCDQHSAGNFYGCLCLTMKEVESCQSVVSGGSSGNNNSGDDNHNGGTSNNDGCKETKGTKIEGTQALAGIDGGCVENDVIAITPEKGEEIDIYYDDTFSESDTKCIHNKMIKSNEDSFYNLMLGTFTDANMEILHYEIGNTPNGEWAITRGHEFNNGSIGFDFYSITTSPLIEESSNLSKMTSLCHELIHAFMYSSLDDLGIIIYDLNGEPYYSTEICVDYDSNVSINSLSVRDRWVALICAFNDNNPGSGQWTHQLFNTAHFLTDVYREELRDFIYTEHDWNSETTLLKVFLQNEFGSAWKEKAAEYLSWKSLEHTEEFQNWAEENGIGFEIDASGNRIYEYHNTVVETIQGLGNKTCIQEIN